VRGREKRKTAGGLLNEYSSFRIRGRRPQGDPAALFGRVADIQGWTSAPSARYELAVSHPKRAVHG
jgi:hypothetical protein